MIEDHRSFHELLLSGVPVAYQDEHGQERYEHARLVDFEDVSNNEFLAVNQLTIIVGGKNRGRTSCCTSTGCRWGRSS